MIWDIPLSLMPFSLHESFKYSLSTMPLRQLPLKLIITLFSLHGVLQNSLNGIRLIGPSPNDFLRKFFQYNSHKPFFPLFMSREMKQRLLPTTDLWTWLSESKSRQRPNPPLQFQVLDLSLTIYPDLLAWMLVKNQILILQIMWIQSEFKLFLNLIHSNFICHMSEQLLIITRYL